MIPNTMDKEQVTQQTEAIVTLTKNAAEQIKQILANQPNAEGKTLRLFVEGGGCSGMQYGLAFDTPRPGDLPSESHGVTVMVDPASADLLRGAVIDYSFALLDGGFKISNPNARHSCGCGKSFGC